MGRLVCAARDASSRKLGGKETASLEDPNSSQFVAVKLARVLWPRAPTALEYVQIVLGQGPPGGSGALGWSVYYAQLQICKSRYRRISCPQVGSLDLNLCPTPTWLVIMNGYSGLVPVQEVKRQPNTLKDGPPHPNRLPLGASGQRLHMRSVPEEKRGEEGLGRWWPGQKSNPVIVSLGEKKINFPL